MTRAYLSALLLLCVALPSTQVFAEEESNSAAPWFCHGLDCPKFEVINSTDKYEIRKLEKGKWAATKVESLLYSVGISEGFQRLFKYISGSNEDDQKIAMTAPVVTRVTPGDGPFCKSLFSVHFFVPFKWQDKPPKPSSPDVHIESAGSETFAVSQFGGYLVDDYTLSIKAKALQAELEKDSVKYENDSFFTAGYDPPFRLQHRHNEIWIRLPSADEAGVSASVPVS